MSCVVGPIRQSARRLRDRKRTLVAPVSWVNEVEKVLTSGQRPAAVATGSVSGWRERAFTSQARPKKRRMEIPYQLGSNSYQARP
jgi:hypothetical protein